MDIKTDLCAKGEIFVRENESPIVKCRLCKVDSKENVEAYLAIRDCVSKELPSKSQMPNGECIFYTNNCQEKCPYYEKSHDNI